MFFFQITDVLCLTILYILVIWIIAQHDDVKLLSRVLFKVSYDDKKKQIVTFEKMKRRKHFLFVPPIDNCSFCFFLLLL